MLGMSSDMFSGVMYQMFVISPAISWILQPGRFSKSRGFMYAVAFLSAMAVISISFQFSEQASNFYHIIGTPRDASLADIKQAFRTRSMELHPDKNPSPQAAEQFTRLRLAFDVLGDADKRVLYDLYGEDAVNHERQTLIIETLIHALSFYGVWSVFTYVLTLGRGGLNARAWSYAGIAVLFILEINLQYAGMQLPPAFFPFMTIFEFVRLMRAAFPLYMNGARAIGGYFFHDLVHDNFLLGIELLKSNKAILLSMRELQGEVVSSRRRVESARPVVATQGDAVPAGARKRHLKFEKKTAAEVSTIKTDPQQQQQQQPSGEETEAWTPTEQGFHQPKPAVQAPPHFQIPGFVYFIAVYFALNYFFN